MKIILNFKMKILNELQLKTNFIFKLQFKNEKRIK